MTRITALCAAGLIASGCCFTLDFGTRGRVVSQTGETATQKPVRRPRAPSAVTPQRANAPATALGIEVFTDYQCPYCRRLHDTLRRLQQQRKGRVQIVLRHNPLPFHDKATPAAIAALAAGRQGKLWEMSDLLFSTPGNLAPERYRRLAEHLKLDVQRFEADMADPALLRQVEADQAEAARRSSRSTPTTFIGDRRIVGSKPYRVVLKIVDEELARISR